MEDLATYIDLWIEDDDIQIPDFEAGFFVEDRACIAQDLIHAIRESGHLEQLIAERSGTTRAFLLADIRDLIESDPRIEPGSVSMDWRRDALWIAAQSEFGMIQTQVGVTA